MHENVTMMDSAPPVGVDAAARRSASNRRAKADDCELLARIAKGDRSAMDELYVRYFAPLARFVQNTTARADLVEDLTNETMFEVWREGAAISPNVSVCLAIMRMAYSQIQKHFALAGPDEARSSSELQNEGLVEPLSTKRTPSDWQRLLARLPLAQRAVVHLVYASGCSRRETADIVGIACEGVDELLREVRSVAKLHFIGASVQPHEIDPTT